MNDRFQIVGARPLPEAAPTKNRHSLRGKPVASAMILSLIALGCLFSELIMTKDPTYLDLAHCSAAPCREFLFGTDTMGRDIFSMIWYGGRLSLFIGVGLDRHFDAARDPLRRGQRTCAQMARRAADAPDRNSSQRAEPCCLSSSCRQSSARRARGASRSASASQAGRASPRSCAPRSGSYARASTSSRRSAWAAAFSTFCGVISHRISSRPSSSWW